MKCKTACIAILFLLVAACASNPAPATPKEEPPSGTWSGDYGPDSSRRESITVDLHWEDNDLRGVVQAGPRSMELTKALFKPETGAITMEFDAQGNNGRTVHYVIEGQVDGGTMAGTWSHDAERGDFRVTRQ